MIRMGRSSKPELPNEESPRPASSIYIENSNSFKSNKIQTAGHAMTESETMARDIKEGRLSGFVGSGTVLTGETNFQSMLRIDGHLTGKVSSSDGTLIIGSTGILDANVKVAAAVVNGTINGDVIASERLEIGRTGRITGNIQTPRLVIDDGAILEGSCNMIKAQESLVKRKAEHESKAAPEEPSGYLMAGEEELAEGVDDLPSEANEKTAETAVN